MQTAYFDCDPFDSLRLSLFSSISIRLTIPSFHILGRQRETEATEERPQSHGLRIRGSLFFGRRRRLHLIDHHHLGRCFQGEQGLLDGTTAEQDECCKVPQCGKREKYDHHHNHSLRQEGTIWRESQEGEIRSRRLQIVPRSTGNDQFDGSVVEPRSGEASQGDCSEPRGG